MSDLYTWARQWGVPFEAVQDLQKRLTGDVGGVTIEGLSEAAVQTRTRVRASMMGWRLWRNNVGVLTDEKGRPVRYGLANESSQINKEIKSGDLIGVRPVTITQAMVGSVIGQFVSVECKAHGWRYAGTPREQAQLKWAQVVQGLGGWASFVSDESQLR